MTRHEDVAGDVLAMARRLDEAGERRHAACIAAYADEIATAVVSGLERREAAVASA